MVRRMPEVGYVLRIPDWLGIAVGNDVGILYHLVQGGGHVDEIYTGASAGGADYLVGELLLDDVNVRRILENVVVGEETRAALVEFVQGVVLDGYGVEVSHHHPEFFLAVFVLQNGLLADVFHFDAAEYIALVAGSAGITLILGNIVAVALRPCVESDNIDGVLAQLQG